MLRYNRLKPLYFLHVPKTAGQSVSRILYNWFQPHYYYHYFDYETNSPPPIRHTLDEKGHPIPGICIGGHFDNVQLSIVKYYPEADQFITFFRDPLETALSKYFFRQRHRKEGTAFGKLLPSSEDLEDFILKCARERSIFPFPFKLTTENYKEIFQSKFVHIGVQEKLQKSMNILAEKLGKEPRKIPHINISERNRKPSKSTIKLFRDSAKLEYEIYEYAASLIR